MTYTSVCLFGKRLMMLVVLLALALGVACPVPAAADVVTNVKIPFTIVSYNPCAQEFMALSGTLHVVERLTTDAAGNVHIGLITNYQGVSAIGETTGTYYQLNQSGSSSFNFNSSVPPPYEVTTVSHLNIIGVGNTPNATAHILTHVTLNANGEITAFVSQVSFECQE